MSFLLPRIYPITDTRLAGIPHAKQVELLAVGGATLIQLRDKHATTRELFASALEAMAAARSRGVRLIINDRVDIAIAADCDGVHLGQEDIPPDRARKLLGPARILGYSTHSLEQAMEANSMPIDYIAVGPIFITSTKQNPDAVVGLEALAEIKRRVSKPVVAIGGITFDTARAVIATGVDSLAIISALYSADQVPETFRVLNTAVGG